MYYTITIYFDLVGLQVLHSTQYTSPYILQYIIQYIVHLTPYTLYTTGIIQYLTLLYVAQSGIILEV